MLDDISRLRAHQNALELIIREMFTRTALEQPDPETWAANQIHKLILETTPNTADLSEHEKRAIAATHRSLNAFLDEAAETLRERVQAPA